MNSARKRIGRYRACAKFQNSNFVQTAKRIPRDEMMPPPPDASKSTVYYEMTLIPHCKYAIIKQYFLT